jgi:hypothetical protein
VPGVASVRAELDDLDRSGALQGSPSEWGPRIWRVLEKTVEIIPCGTCKSEARVMVSGMHDIVNVARGKPAHRPEALCALAQQSARAAESSKSCRLTIRPQRSYG